MLSIKIKKDGSNLAAVANSTTLFSFAYRKELNSWLFWVRGRSNYEPITSEGRAFPWNDFYDLCRVEAFLVLNLALWRTVNPKVVSGKSYVR